jgi:hypothetical protein
MRMNVIGRCGALVFLALVACSDGERTAAGSAGAPPGLDSIPKQRAPTFEVENKKLTDHELETMIADGKVTADIVAVELSSNQLTSRALELLVASPLVRLEVLNLYDNPIDDAGANVIAHEKLFRGLGTLNISHTRITRAGVEALFAPDSMMVGPIRLSLNGLPIGDAGLDALLASRFAANLSTLSIADTGVTNAGIRRLAEGKTTPKLKFVQLSKEGLEPETIEALAEIRSGFKYDLI